MSSIERCTLSQLSCVLMAPSMMASTMSHLAPWLAKDGYIVRYSELDVETFLWKTNLANTESEMLAYRCGGMAYVDHIVFLILERFFDIFRDEMQLALRRGVSSKKTEIGSNKKLKFRDETVLEEEVIFTAHYNCNCAECNLHGSYLVWRDFFKITLNRISVQWLQRSVCIVFGGALSTIPCEWNCNFQSWIFIVRASRLRMYEDTVQLDTSIRLGTVIQKS